MTRRAGSTTAALIALAALGGPAAAQDASPGKVIERRILSIVGTGGPGPTPAQQLVDMMGWGGTLDRFREQLRTAQVTFPATAGTRDAQ
jgi:hypothetical protein